MIDEKEFPFESRYEALVASHSDLISRFSPEGILTFVSKTYCKYLDKSYQQLVGSSLYDDKPQDERQKIKSRFDSLSPSSPTIHGTNSIEVGTEKNTLSTG